ncbi:sterol desaturase family protein [Marivivens donghaensis]|uniref:Sterol desaturase family protein n=1 Tax=Marivivens donghaensis TaxID=1699413 RepID=A0ABX0W4H0_9RHOB|nr:sterol desaturase family protein [Marivivens donghaensis]NIY73753.1 sterol desaturase family protein [Marivivens donghaensis]
MGDLKFGTRDKRGNWAPNEPLDIAPFWTGKFDMLGEFARAYLWPWNAFHMAMTLASWFLLIQPNLALFQTFSLAGFALLLAAKAVCIFAMYGSIELFFYVRRKQDNRFKYNAKFPSENPSDVFWFKSQNLDNFVRSMFMSVPIWTVIEVIFLYCFANVIHAFGWLRWEDSWVDLVVLTLITPMIHEVHFFCIHWLIHQQPLYKWVHSVHHNSINPSPWSSLSMHPVEGLLYFGTVALHLALYSHPFLVLWRFNLAAFAAIVGRIGFDLLEVGKGRAIESHAYAHYLHHKYFEVNYCDDGVLPWDRWFGTWHDGSKEADEEMKARFRVKREKLRAKGTGGATSP